MKKLSLVFLQTMVVLLGMCALAFLLIEPHFEGRNVNATVFEIYFKDPFLAYAYAASTLFFIALYQTFTVLDYLKRSESSMESYRKALRTIRRCALTLIALIGGAEAYLFIFMRGKDDIAGGVAMGLFLILVLTVVTICAKLFERHLERVKTSASLSPA